MVRNLEKLAELIKYNGIRYTIENMTFRGKVLSNIKNGVLNVACLEVENTNEIKKCLENIIKIQKVANANFEIIGKTKERGVTFWQIKEI